MTMRFAMSSAYISATGDAAVMFIVTYHNGAIPRREAKP